MELRTYASEREKWIQTLDKRHKDGFHGLTPTLQTQYHKWLTHGQTRQLICDMKKEKLVSQQGSIGFARLKTSCVGITLKIQPDDSSVQVMIQIGQGDWREIRCYYARRAFPPDFADIIPGHFFDADTEEHETEDESNDSLGKEMEEMDYTSFYLHQLKKHKLGSDWNEIPCYYSRNNKKRRVLSNRYWGPPAECEPTEIDSDSSVAPTVLIDVDTLA